jgi:uncharacterized protein YjbI with pentapeptide repeats
LKNQGYDDETAYRMTIDSIGDISELIESSIFAKTRELLQKVRTVFSNINLQNSDFKGVIGSSFKWADLTNVRFDGADLTGAKIIQSDLKYASFISCVLDNTDFNGSDLLGVVLIIKRSLVLASTTRR